MRGICAGIMGLNIKFAELAPIMPNVNQRSNTEISC